MSCFLLKDRITYKKNYLSQLSICYKETEMLHLNMIVAMKRKNKYRVFSHDVTAAILVSQDDETAAMLVSQTSPVGFELFSYVNAFFCSNKFA